MDNPKAIVESNKRKIMSINNLVRIKQFNIIGEDERGLTADFCLPRKQDNFIFITRKAGSLSGLGLKIVGFAAT